MLKQPFGKEQTKEIICAAQFFTETCNDFSVCLIIIKDLNHDLQDVAPPLTEVAQY